MGKRTTVGFWSAALALSLGVEAAGYSRLDPEPRAYARERALLRRQRQRQCHPGGGDAHRRQALRRRIRHRPSASTAAVLWVYRQSSPHTTLNLTSASAWSCSGTTRSMLSNGTPIIRSASFRMPAIPTDTCLFLPRCRKGALNSDTSVGFNIGIEIGQLLFLGAVAVVVSLLGRAGRLRVIENLPALASGSAALFGTALLLQRLLVG